MSEDVLLLIFTYCPPIKLEKNHAIGDKRGKKRAKKYRPAILSKGDTLLVRLAL